MSEGYDIEHETGYRSRPAPARRLPEESLRRARNILLNLDETEILSVMDRAEWLRMEDDMTMARNYLLTWAHRIEDLRPKPEEGGEHGQG